MTSSADSSSTLFQPFQRRVTNGFDDLPVRVMRSSDKPKDESFRFDAQLAVDADEFLADSACNIFKQPPGSTKTPHDSVLNEIQNNFKAIHLAVRRRSSMGASISAVTNQYQSYGLLPKPLADTPARRCSSRVRRGSAAPGNRSRARSSDDDMSRDSSVVSSAAYDSTTTPTSRLLGSKDRRLERKDVEEMDRRMKMRVTGRSNRVSAIRHLLLNDHDSSDRLPGCMTRAKEMEHELKEQFENDIKQRHERRLSLSNSRSRSPTTGPRRRISLTTSPTTNNRLDMSSLDDDDDEANCRNTTLRSCSINNISNYIIQRVVESKPEEKERHRYMFRRVGRSSSVPSIRDISAIVMASSTSDDTNKMKESKKVTRRMFMRSKSPSAAVEQQRRYMMKPSKHEEHSRIVKKTQHRSTSPTTRTVMIDSPIGGSNPILEKKTKKREAVNALTDICRRMKGHRSKSPSLVDNQKVNKKKALTPAQKEEKERRKLFRRSGRSSSVPSIRDMTAILDNGNPGIQIRPSRLVKSRSPDMKDISRKARAHRSKSPSVDDPVKMKSLTPAQKEEKERRRKKKALSSLREPRDRDSIALLEDCANAATLDVKKEKKKTKKSKKVSEPS